MEARKRQRKQTPPLERCQKLLPQVPDRLPFGPGEELGYIVNLSGVYVGRISLEIGDRGSLGDAVIYPAHAHATTNSFFRKMSKVESRMTSYITPDGVVPLAMFSRSESDRAVRLEEASFDVAARAAEATLKVNSRHWTGKIGGGLPLQDVVSVVYFARSREVELGREYCTELYYGKRRWLVSGKVEAVQSVSTPAGPYRALKISGEAVREGPPAYSRRFTVWITDDEDRLPVRLTSPGRLGDIEVTVDHFKRGRRLVKG